MAASDIAITSFSVVPGVGIITLGAIAAPPAGFEDLSYMQPAKLRFFRNSTNNASTAVQIGESTAGVLSYETTATFYYFAAAVDPAGNEGPRTSGILCVPKVAVPDGSVTTPKLADGAVKNAKIGNAEITDAKIYSMSADKLTAGTVTVTISLTSPILNGGTITGSKFETTGGTSKTTIYNGIVQIVGSEGGGSYCTFLGGENQAALMGARSNVMAVVAENSNTGNNAHAMRCRNTGTGGGHAVLGVSADGGGWGLNAQTGGVYSAGGYSPFTGKHECLVRKDAVLDVGDIAAVKRTIIRNGLDNVLAEVERSEIGCDRRVIGIVSKRKEVPLFSQIAALGPEPSDREVATPVRKRLAEQYDLVTVNALGEGQMEVCGRGGDISAGDYIVASDLAGKGERLDMDQPATFALQAAIIAQAMVDVTFDGPDHIKRVACFYRCG